MVRSRRKKRAVRRERPRRRYGTSTSAGKTRGAGEGVPLAYSPEGASAAASLRHPRYQPSARWQQHRI